MRATEDDTIVTSRTGSVACENDEIDSKRRSALAEDVGSRKALS
jgi:hypothetical protein